MKEIIRKTVYLLLAAAFFAVPCFWKPARDYAPGLAVIAGIIFAVTWGNPFKEYTSKFTSTLLGATIVGMGFGMNLMEVLKAGANGIVYTIIGICAGIGLGASRSLPTNMLMMAGGASCPPRRQSLPAVATVERKRS